MVEEQQQGNGNYGSSFGKRHVFYPCPVGRNNGDENLLSAYPPTYNPH